MELTLEEVKNIIVRYTNDNKIYPIAKTLMKGIYGLPTKYCTYKIKYGMTLKEIIDSCNITGYKMVKKPKNFTNEYLLNTYKRISEHFGYAASFSDINDFKKNIDPSVPTGHTFLSHFESIDKLADKLGLKKIRKGQRFNKEYLINEMKRFYKESGSIPTQKDFENRKGYPSRKSFANNFGSFNNALREAGFEVVDTPNYYDKEYLLSEINRFVSEYGRQPFSREIDKIKGYPSKNYYQKMFGSWNNAIKELGLKVRVSQYSKQELDDAFFSFVNEHGRPPILHEFNADPRYPSFWCYQNRFGSWNNTLLHYGFEVNDGTAGKHFQFENGEVCKSTYEYDISNWLREKNISYLRNVPYKDFIDEYEGKKDCDYVIIHNEEWIWLEIAGLYTNKEKKSNMEKHYIKAFNHKLENLLCQFNYKILYPEDFKNKDFDSFFKFLWDIPKLPWDAGEPIYQGIAEDVLEWVQKS